MQEVFNNMNLESVKGKTIHFIGIGGVSMSGIAKCFHENGAKVQGSDSSPQSSKYIEDFPQIGIKVFEEHEAKNITNQIDLIVQTSTISQNNPEILQAQSLGIKIIERYEALEIILSTFKTKIGISGSSGKTTTTALIWQALCSAGKTKHSCLIGTILNETNSTIFVNRNSEICITEADESDGSFALMNFTVAVITDIDTDHLEHHRYQNKQENLINHFRLFAKKTLQNGGIVIYNSNCKTSHSLMEEFTEFKNHIFSYSGIEIITNTPKHIQGSTHLHTIKNIQSGVQFSCKGFVEMQNIQIPIIGTINAFNALPALILTKIIYGSLSQNLFHNFQGINKRAEIVGKNKHFAVIDDYAHSPKKIHSFIASFSSYCKSINAQFIIICEPHKYTRVASLYKEYLTCFDQTNHLILMEIFGIQGGDELKDTSSENLAKDIQKNWQIKKNQTFYIKSLKNNNSILNKETFQFMEEIFQTKNFVFFVFLGAGTSSKYAHLFWNNMKVNYVSYFKHSKK